MSNSAFASVSIVAAAMLLSFAAAAAENGSCVLDGKKIQWVDGVAYHVPDHSNSTIQDLGIALTAEAIDRAKVDASTDIDETMIFHTFADRFVFKIKTGDVHEIYANISGTNINNNGTDPIGTLKLTSNDAKHVAGTFEYLGTATNKLACDLKFDVPLVR